MERIYTIARDGMVLQVVATDVAPPEYAGTLDNGGVLVTISCLEGSADINALFWGGDGEAGSFIDMSTGRIHSYNLNGVTTDDGTKIAASSWDGSTDISPVGMTTNVLEAGSSMPRMYLNVSLDQLDMIGIRVQCHHRATQLWTTARGQRGPVHRGVETAR
jgi:hypothetical protein